MSDPIQQADPSAYVEAITLLRQAEVADAEHFRTCALCREAVRPCAIAAERNQDVLAAQARVALAKPPLADAIEQASARWMSKSFARSSSAQVAAFFPGIGLIAQKPKP